jgi:hypothetical protein
MGDAFSMAFVSFVKHRKLGTIYSSVHFIVSFDLLICMFLIPMGHAFPMPFVSFVKHRKLGTISFPRSFFSEKSSKKGDNTHKVCL